MKKAIVVLLALAFVSAMAFADDAKATVAFTGNVKAGALVTIPNTGDAMIQGWDNDNGSNGYAKMALGATLGNFSANFYLVSTDFTTWTIPNAWVTDKFLNDMLEIRAGIIDNGVTGTVNKGYGGISGTGIQVVLNPITGLSLGALVPAPINTNNKAATTAGTAATLSDAMQFFRVGFAYTMADMFTLDATFIGDTGSTVGELAKPELDAGVAVLAVPNLTAQLEANIGTYTDAPMNIFQNVTYAIGDLTVGANALETLQANTDAVIGITPTVSYKLGAIPTVSAQVGYTMNGANDGQVAPQLTLGLVFNTLATLNIQYNGYFNNPTASVSSNKNTFLVDFIHSF